MGEMVRAHAIIRINLPRINRFRARFGLAVRSFNFGG